MVHTPLRHNPPLFPLPIRRQQVPQARKCKRKVLEPDGVALARGAAVRDREQRDAVVLVVVGQEGEVVGRLPGRVRAEEGLVEGCHLGVLGCAEDDVGEFCGGEDFGGGWGCHFFFLALRFLEVFFELGFLFEGRALVVAILQILKERVVKTPNSRTLFSYVPVHSKVESFLLSLYLPHRSYNPSS